MDVNELIWMYVSYNVNELMNGCMYRTNGCTNDVCINRCNILMDVPMDVQMMYVSIDV